MTTQITWCEGYNNYKKHTLTTNEEKVERFHTEILDVELMDTTNIFEIFNEHLNQRQTRTVEVCYSGGLDSELTLISCLHNKIPARAITMRIFTGEVLLNTHDVYYSESFCREHNVEQKFVDLDIVKFYETGAYIEMLRPYKIKAAGAALQVWLLNQCTGFTVLGGDYSWPWIVKPVISPHSHGYNMFGKIMKDLGIHGISNMLGYSLDSNLQFLASHLKVYDHEKHDPSNSLKLPYLKRDVFEDVGFKNLRPRLKAYGLDMVPRRPYNNVCIELFGDCTNSVSWGKSVSKLLGENPGYNESK